MSISFFISDAVASSSGSAPSGGSAMGSIIMLVGFILIFYFLLWRPQSKRAKEHRELVSGLARGDEVVTAGGIMGRITRLVGDDMVMLSIADGVEIKMKKGSISTVLPKGSLQSDAK